MLDSPEPVESATKAQPWLVVSRFALLELVDHKLLQQRSQVWLMETVQSDPDYSPAFLVLMWVDYVHAFD